MINERADVLARVLLEPIEGMVAVASEGFCPVCGSELRLPITPPVPPVVPWCNTCQTGWQVHVTLWPDARHVDLDQYDWERRVGSHGWVDHR